GAGRGGGEGAAAATPGENATPSSVAPLAPMPALRPRTALAILRICGEEMRLLCGDVPPGGSRVISCLAEHAPRLSPVCYRALAAARNYWTGLPAKRRAGLPSSN